MSFSNDSSTGSGLPTGSALPHWQGAQPPPSTPMRGRWCSVVPLDADAHGAALYEAYAGAEDARDWCYLPYGPFDDEAAFRNWLKTYAGGNDPLFHTVLDGDGVPVGVASYLRIAPAQGVIEVGHIHYSPRMQRSPVATEAMYLMMRRVFDELGYRRYEWKCDSLNARSRAAALRFGFTYEGLFRQAAVVKQRNRDTTWFAIVDGDWPAIREAFEAWLAPHNFDGNGVQRSKLHIKDRD